MTGEHMCEMFTKASTQKMWPAGVKVYSSDVAVVTFIFDVTEFFCNTVQRF